MPDLAVAIEQQQWELVALYVLLGVTEAASRLPPEAIDDLLEILSPEGEGESGDPRSASNEEKRGGRG